MAVKENLFEKDFEKCFEFHGHICPGLTIGYRAAKGGLEWLKENRAVDEEIVAVTETDACCVDAIQVLTGCTMGKGNLIYRDYGKMVFTFFSRKTGDGVRLSLKADVMEEIHEDEREDFTLQNEKKFPEFRPAKTKAILEKPLEELFTLKSVNVGMPSKAKIEFSNLCEECKEPVMSSKLKEVDGKKLCGDCCKGNDF